MTKIQNDDEFDHTILAGDFNFRDEIVKWELCNNGLVPIYEPGRTCKIKKGFSLLLDLIEDFDLEQIVDENTREDQILDLIFTD